MLIRVGDMVKVTAGDDKDARGKVLKVDRHANKVTVEGINRVYKHVRRSQKNPQGGRLSLEMPIAGSNVLLVCESCGDAARFGVRFLDDGMKERYCKKCGAAGGQIAPPKPAYAKRKG